MLWSRLYGEDYLPTYEEAVRRIKAKDNKRYTALHTHMFFDIEHYMKRTLLSVEILLLEANTRAEKQNTTAFLHVVGFGLGRIIELFTIDYLTGSMDIALFLSNFRSVEDH